MDHLLALFFEYILIYVREPRLTLLLPYNIARRGLDAHICAFSSVLRRYFLVQLGSETLLGVLGGQLHLKH